MMSLPTEGMNPTQLKRHEKSLERLRKDLEIEDEGDDEEAEEAGDDEGEE